MTADQDLCSLETELSCANGSAHGDMTDGKKDGDNGHAAGPCCPEIPEDEKAVPDDAEKQEKNDSGSKPLLPENEIAALFQQLDVPGDRYVRTHRIRTLGNTRPVSITICPRYF